MCSISNNTLICALLYTNIKVFLVTKRSNRTNDYISATSTLPESYAGESNRKRLSRYDASPIECYKLLICSGRDKRPFAARTRFFKLIKPQNR
jgi:hypothetical protein